jgi:hypothetical protein
VVKAGVPHTDFVGALTVDDDSLWLLLLVLSGLKGHGWSSFVMKFFLYGKWSGNLFGWLSGLSAFLFV